MPLFRSKKTSSVPSYDYNPETERPIIRASICTGEQVAGFKNKTNGAFHEHMLIQSEEDLTAFKDAFELDHVDKEY